MGLKHLIVHLDGTARCARRVELAVGIARKHGARLLGVFAQFGAEERVGYIANWPPKEYAQAAAASRAAFEAACAGVPDFGWVDANCGSEAEIVRRVTDLARHVDLVVFGQHDETQPVLVPPSLALDVVLHAGRPVLVIPYIGDFRDPGQRPLIAWKDSRESARALNDALPLMAGASSAHLLAIARERGAAEAACSAAQLHLRCHGIDVATEAFPLDEDDGVAVMDLLLNRAADRSADLLVMGARGSIAGLPIGSRGAGTRHILQHMTLPVLMSN
ncbi:MAG TPA: universal stress protein [Burkholderiaceae bacterium]|nr:universal stress protein [Burkholderiaceae bacterium]